MAHKDLLSEKLDVRTSKRKSSPLNNSHRPRKITKILLEEDSEGGGNISSDSREVSTKPDKPPSNDHTLAINQDFAQRFEHNKKREERQRRALYLSCDCLGSPLIFAQSKRSMAVVSQVRRMKHQEKTATMVHQLSPLQTLRMRTMKGF